MKKLAISGLLLCGALAPAGCERRLEGAIASLQAREASLRTASSRRAETKAEAARVQARWAEASARIGPREIEALQATRTVVEQRRAADGTLTLTVSAPDALIVASGTLAAFALPALARTELRELTAGTKGYKLVVVDHPPVSVAKAAPSRWTESPSPSLLDRVSGRAGDLEELQRRVATLEAELELDLEATVQLREALRRELEVQASRVTLGPALREGLQGLLGRMPPMITSLRVQPKGAAMTVAVIKLAAVPAADVMEALEGLVAGAHEGGVSGDNVDVTGVPVRRAPAKPVATD